MGILGGHDESVECVGAPKTGEDRTPYAVTAHPIYFATDLQRSISYIEEVVYSIVSEQTRLLHLAADDF